MKNIHIICLLLLVYDECSGRILSTTVNLVSVLRKNLMKNNEDFESSMEMAQFSPKPTHYSQPVAPVYPPRRSEYLQPNKLLDVNGDPTVFEEESYTFEIDQPIETETQTASLTTEMNSQVVRAGKETKLKSKTTNSKKSSKTTSKLTTVSNESNVFNSEEIISRMAVKTTQVTYGVADITDKKRLIFNEALKNHIKELKFISMKNLTPGKNALRILTYQTTQIPDFTGSRFEDMMAHIATKDWRFNSKAPPLLVQTYKAKTKKLYFSDEEQWSGDEHHPPDGQMLDLALVKGDLARSQRQRNRICNRNILVPEGPKYGVINQGTKASVTIKDQDFSQTKGPKYILPRCCNCCKKSVLGCE